MKTAGSPSRFLAGLFAAAFGFSHDFVGRASGAVDERPNILLLLADNWSYAHSSFAGDRTVQTPNFDRLAREGVSFRNAFCPVPSCTPTRASMLTGRYAHQLGEAANLWSGLPREYPVFTDLLRAAGYQVGYTGKGWAPGNHIASGWTENPVGRRYADLGQFLRETPSGRPFFFWLGNLDTAIGQWDYRAEAAEGLDPGSVVVPPHLPDTPEVRRSALAYYNGVRKFDRLVGQARELLEQQKLLDRTIIICAGDNGWQIPRGLANCYDDGTRVPLVVWGRSIPGGRQRDEFVSLGEFAPTVLELAGMSAPASMTFGSFAGLVRGAAATEPRDAVFLERERHANVRQGDLGYPIRGIRTAEHLFLLNLRPDRWPAGDPKKHQSVGPYGDVDNSPAKDAVVAGENDPQRRGFFDLVLGHRPAEELYELSSDPGQVRNRADDPRLAAVKEALRQRVIAWMRATDDPRVKPGDDSFDAYKYHGDVNTWDKDNFDGAHLFKK